MMVAFKHRKYRKPSSPQEGREAFFKKAGDRENHFFSPANQHSIQTKLTIGKPGDPFEREADAVADRVVNDATTQRSSSGIQPQSLIQRQEDSSLVRMQMQAPEKEELNPKPELQRQPEEEEEIQPKPELQRQPEEEEEIQPKPELQRQPEEEEEIQPKTDAQAQAPSRSLVSHLHNTKGTGRPLPKSIQLEMGQTFKQNFTDVRIHTDDEAISMNRQLHSQAFTHGRDIYFNRGKYDPESTQGKRLLAHELTHIVQQKQK